MFAITTFTTFMSAIFGVVIIVGVIIFFEQSRRVTRRAKDVERALKMVPLLVKLPPLESSGSDGTSAQGQVVANIAQADQLFTLLSGVAHDKKMSHYNNAHIGFEIVAYEDQVYFYVIAPYGLLQVIENALTSSYPAIQIKQVNDYNIFSDASKITGVAGGEVTFESASHMPLNDYKKTASDNLAAVLNNMSELKAGEGAAVQILIRPTAAVWSKNAQAEAKKLTDPKAIPQKAPLSKTLVDIAKAPVKAPTVPGSETEGPPKLISEIDVKQSQLIAEKAASSTFETLIRIITSSQDHARSASIAQAIASTFAAYTLPGSNGFTYKPAADEKQFATDYIFRFFPATRHETVLSTSELASIFHLPGEDAKHAAVPVERVGQKEVAAPSGLPESGLILGSNFYRGSEHVVKLTTEDRRRHMYIVGQTGTGKSVTLENCVVQDMAAGGGLAFIDPHGDTAEKLLAKVPPERAKDVIYFNPADTQMPLGLNLLQFERPEQKDFLVQETINMLYRLYDPGKTGIIGPRFEQWYRNAALTIMSDPEGSTLLEIPKVFTDNEFLKRKFRFVTDPTVQDFWTKEMAQTSDYHKSEMLGWFVSKFGAFASNEIMRNIIGQKQSAFDLRQIMDEGKILIVNLSKGLVGELNSQLLGMIFVIKFQAAAMSRSNVEEAKRRDFTLYVDEFQNFSTDSFATILSEARKYHLNLIVANQFIGQLNEQVRDAVFGNVGTILSLRCGPEDAEFLAKQFAPSFTSDDLVNMQNLNGALRMIVAGAPATPFSLKILFPPVGQARAEVASSIIEYSRTHYGKPKLTVDKIVADSLTAAAPKPTPPPSALAAQP